MSLCTGGCGAEMPEGEPRCPGCIEGAHILKSLAARGAWAREDEAAKIVAFLETCRDSATDGFAWKELDIAIGGILARAHDGFRPSRRLTLEGEIGELAMRVGLEEIKRVVAFCNSELVQHVAFIDLTRERATEAEAELAKVRLKLAAIRDALSADGLSLLARRAFRDAGYQQVQFGDGSWGIVKASARLLRVVDVLIDAVFNVVHPVDAPKAEEGASRG